MVSAPGFSGGSIAITITIKADSRDQTNSPLFFGWDKDATSYSSNLVLFSGNTFGFNTNNPSTGNQGYKLTGDYTDDSLIKLCVKTLNSNLPYCGNTVVKNVTIKLPEYDNNMNAGNEQPLGVSPNNSPCAERIISAGQTDKNNRAAFVNATKGGATGTGDKINSYLRLSYANDGDCNIGPNDFTLTTNEVNTGPYQITFHSIRLDPASANIVWTNSGSGTQVSSPGGWLSIAKK